MIAPSYLHLISSSSEVPKSKTKALKTQLLGHSQSPLRFISALIVINNKQKSTYKSFTSFIKKLNSVTHIIMRCYNPKTVKEKKHIQFD